MTSGTWLAEKRRIATALRALDEARDIADLPDVAQTAAALDADGISLCLTGAPGVGKSSLIGGMVGLDQPWPGSVGVVAADPASPFSGGAVLADRNRMPAASADRRLFVRSMPTAEGAVPARAYPAVQTFLTTGFDLVVLETVGSGQALDQVGDYCDVLVLVLGPDFGDAMQLMKAGVLEAAHAVVISKTDLGSHASAIRSGIRTSSARPVPTFEVRTDDPAGVAAFLSWLGGERDRLAGSAELRSRRARHRTAEFRRVVHRALHQWLVDAEASVDVNQILDSPWRAAAAALAHLPGSRPTPPFPDVSPELPPGSRHGPEPTS